jgi:molybdopterin-guanine dinucleotide biosynthesis protein A
MGVDKAFVSLDGRPLISHVIDRLHPQVAALAISANGDTSRFADLGLPILADDPADRDAGPLAGVAAGLAYAAREGWPLVATTPCDAPFAPVDFVARLSAAMAESGSLAALVEGPNGLEPLFALWRADALARLRVHLAEGGRSPRDFLIALGAARARFAPAEGGEPFANLNNPADLEHAQAKLRPA